MKKRKFPKNRV